MTIEEIRKGAPEGATGYIEYNGVTYHKLSSSIWYFWDAVFSTWEYMHPSWTREIKPL